MNRNIKTGNQIGDDYKLVQEVISGSESAWHCFIESYSRLIHMILRRYITSEEDVHDVYIEVLESLYQGQLATYKPTARLSTWLTIVSRTKAIDSIRRKYGRQRIPESLKDLSEADREIFYLFYIKGLDFDSVRYHKSTGRKEPLRAEVLAAALNRIESRLSSNTLRRLGFNSLAFKAASTSNRMLEYIQYHRSEIEAQNKSQNPESILMIQEMQKVALQLHKLISDLPAPENQCLYLYYYKGFSARKVANQLQLKSARQAYTIIQRGIKQLRKSIRALSIEY